MACVQQKISRSGWFETTYHWSNWVYNTSHADKHVARAWISSFFVIKHLDSIKWLRSLCSPVGLLHFIIRGFAFEKCKNVVYSLHVRQGIMFRHYGLRLSRPNIPRKTNVTEFCSIISAINRAVRHTASFYLLCTNVHAIQHYRKVKLWRVKQVSLWERLSKMQPFGLEIETLGECNYVTDISNFKNTWR